MLHLIFLLLLNCSGNAVETTTKNSMASKEPEEIALELIRDSQGISEKEIDKIVFEKTKGQNRLDIELKIKFILNKIKAEEDIDENENGIYYYDRGYFYYEEYL